MVNAMAMAIAYQRIVELEQIAQIALAALDDLSKDEGDIATGSGWQTPCEYAEAQASRIRAALANTSKGNE